MKPNLSVIICTYNRCESLAKTLASIAALSFSEQIEWEVVVVDNKSCDHTHEVVQQFCNRFAGRFRYVFEEQPGKSFALNRGIREARGEVLAFTDDDVTVEPRWLEKLTANLKDDRWAGAGGRTLAAQAFTAAEWLGIAEPYNLGGVLAALFDLGDEPKELSQAPYGANMAVRRAMFEKHGNFRTDLGPSPNREIPRPNEDTEFGRRLMTAGERFLYEPAAIVYHPIQEERLRKGYFLAWYFDFGRARVREWGWKPSILGIPRRYLNLLKISCLVFPWRALLWILDPQPRRRFFRKCWAWMTVGEICEIWSQLGPRAEQRGAK